MSPLQQPLPFESPHITIIGGGMVGASLALLLAKQNPQWHIVLLDAQAFPANQEFIYQPSFDSRSTAIAQGSVDILQDLGVWEKLAEHATAIAQVHVSDAGHFMGGLIKAHTYKLDAVGYVVPNQWIGRVLLQALHQHSNIHCIAPAQVTRLLPKQQGMGIQFTLTGESHEFVTSLAVLADGGASPLRQSLGISTTTKDYAQTAIITNLAYTTPHQGIAYERFTDLGPLALLPLGESPQACESALVLTLPTQDANDLLQKSDAEFLQHIQTRFGSRLGQFTRVGQRVAYPLQLTTADEQIRSHLVLLGNAAHYLHPVAGQGFNLSLRDCACLTKTLSDAAQEQKNIGEISVLNNYLDAQAADQLLTIEFSDKLVRLFSTKSFPLIALRHLGFLGLDLLPPLKKQFAAQTMGTATTQYIES